ncbi:serine protease [Sulfitobacter sp. D35]|uniref:S1 family peptidase n=1 Tax=Sulfitobacter sp. D35 TaxID=3083252 RepID=UPI00296F42A6|nr:serine protease [Sulfitobacter sp. D35]MDW4500565.1 serine protease [Sulfitobacter sp. D35]
MKQIRLRNLIVAGTISAVALPSQASDVCDAQHYQTQFYDDDLKRYALAHVYPHDRNAPYAGNAFVVDIAHGLVLTAFHVVKDALGDLPQEGDEVDLYFPGLQSGGTGTVATARVLDRLQLEGGNDSKTVKDDVVRDIALLKIEGNIPSGLQSFRLGFDAEQFAETKVLSYFGGVSDAYEFDVSVQRAKVSRDRFAKCRLQYFNDVGAGDSGGPVVEAYNARAIGMVLTSRTEGDRVVGEILPFHCTGAILSAWMSEHLEDEIKQTLEVLFSMDELELSNFLRDARTDEKVSNLKLMAMMSILADSTLLPDLDEDTVRAWIQATFNCPVWHAIRGRQIGAAALVPNLTRRMTREASLRSAADTRYAKAIRTEDSLEKNALLKEAVFFYRASALEQQQQLEFAVLGASDLAVEVNPVAPVTFKGLADSLFALAGQTHGANTTKLLQESATAALISAALGQERVPEVSAQALTTFASVASKLDQHDSAAEAWATAWANGARAEWVAQSYDFDVSKRDDYFDKSANQNYVPIGNASNAVAGDFARQLLTEAPPKWLGHQTGLTGLDGKIGLELYQAMEIDGQI